MSMGNHAEPGPHPGATPSGPSSGRFPAVAVVAILAILFIGGVAGLIVFRRAQSGGAEKKGGPAGRGPAGPIPAVLGTVEARDFPIYLDGLGTVQAFNTVTIRSRVDGQLKKISFQEGQDVRVGDVLALIDPDPYRTQVEQMEAKKAQDEAQLQNAQIELNRDKKLLADKILAQDVFDTQKALVDQLTATVKADQAAIDNARVQLNYTTITSPIEGRAGLRLIDEGNIIRSGDSNGIVVLTQLRPISIVFTLPEQSINDIQQHQAEGPRTILALDRDNRTVLDEGKLAVIDNQIDTTTGTIRLKGTFPNPGLKLWPGQFVNARLLLSVRTNGIVVPASVVQRGPEGPYAFVVKGDMTVEMAKVKVAEIDQGLALIDSGLTPGQRVVVDGQYKLQLGSKVKPAGTPGADERQTNLTPGTSRAPGSGKSAQSGSAASR
jgi:multidrug efflux system membrane fusion protein